MSRRPVTLTVMAPCSFLTANQRIPWQVRYRMVRAWKRAALEAAQAQGLGPIPTPVHITATVHRNHSRAGRWDPANWADTAKAVVDGIVLAGVLVDDSLDHVTGPDMRPGDGWADAGLTLTITTLEPALLEPEPTLAPAVTPSLWDKATR
jgi:hypothetical protein